MNSSKFLVGLLLNYINCYKITVLWKYYNWSHYFKCYGYSGLNGHLANFDLNTYRFKTSKNHQKLRFKKFSVFFRLKPAPGHGLSENATLSHTAFVSWKTIGVGQTDGRTDGRTACQFLGALCFDNHPFGVDNNNNNNVFIQWTCLTVQQHFRNTCESIAV